MKDLETSRKVPEFLTTGQIATYCGVNFRTVIRWIKKGLLQAQRLPGRGDHRVSRVHFLEFLEKNQLLIPETLQPTPNPSISSSGNLQKNSSTHKVLIVDDDPITANAIQRVLTINGYQTKTAHDGFEAGRLIESFKPSLLTLDLLMQGIDGIAVLKTLKTESKFDVIKVIVISADSDAKIEEALNLGASKALKKPFSNKELIATVANLIGKPPEDKTQE